MWAWQYPVQKYVAGLRAQGWQWNQSRFSIPFGEPSWTPSISEDPCGLVRVQLGLEQPLDLVARVKGFMVCRGSVGLTAHSSSVSAG